MARNAAYRKAEQKIEAARRSGAKELDLRNMKLTKLPDTLWQLTELQKLDLGGDPWNDEKNQLSELSESIGQLTGLQTLNLSENQLTALPEMLGLLENLKDLDIRWNQQNCQSLLGKP